MEHIDVELNNLEESWYALIENYYYANQSRVYNVFQVKLFFVDHVERSSILLLGYFVLQMSEKREMGINCGVLDSCSNCLRQHVLVERNQKEVYKIKGMI